MSNETRGKALQQRMFALGMDESKLSRAIGRDRGTIRRAFAGSASEATYNQLEVWFDREERKLGTAPNLEPLPIPAATQPEPPQEQKHVMIRIEEGGTVVVDGPPDNMNELIAAAKELMREMKARREGA